MDGALSGEVLVVPGDQVVLRIAPRRALRLTRPRTVRVSALGLDDQRDDLLTDQLFTPARIRSMVMLIPGSKHV